jgi:predicted GNAT superfamily acetyltransferase
LTVIASWFSTPCGIRHGKPYWHSGIGVAGHWNSGVALKTRARRSNRPRNPPIEWTFDPLESKNAYLNIEKLGVIVRRYYPNHYGPVSSGIFQGLDSDRVVAEWWLGKPRIPVTGETRRVEIPRDLQSLKKHDIEAAREIQRRVRKEFLQNAQDDFAVALERTNEASEYIFVRGASRAYSSD